MPSSQSAARANLFSSVPVWNHARKFIFISQCAIRLHIVLPGLDAACRLCAVRLEISHKRYAAAIRNFIFLSKKFKLFKFKISSARGGCSIKIAHGFRKILHRCAHIAAATDKICSSLDKIARDNRQNSVKISRRAGWVRPCSAASYTPYSWPRKRLYRFGFRTKISICFSLLRLGALAWTTRG